MLVIRPSMTPDSSAVGTSPNAMTTGFAFQASSTGFSAGPMLRTLRPVKSSALR
ncbi:hypothetical protein D3C83_118990 [compost metagenome]